MAISLLYRCIIYCPVNATTITENKMAKENIIVWQKWVDPFGGDDVIENNMLASFLQDLDEEPFLEEDYEQEEHEEDSMESHSISSKKSLPIRVMATPMGIIPVTENTASGKIFNFWIGHTNFNISKRVSDIIEETEGVETLDVFTRYRFRIAVGKAFSDSEVMRDINVQLYKVLDNA